MFDTLTRRIGSIFKGISGKGRLSADDVNDMLREVRVALLEADVNLAVAKEFIAHVKEKAVGEAVFASLDADQTIVRIVRDELVDMLGTETARLNFGPSPPAVILLCGLQGSGKTTTAAKLAVWLKVQGKKPMLAACDIQRPAAVKQLEVLGESVGVSVYAQMDGSDPAKIARNALQRCAHLMNDVLIVDTAGRLHVDDDLMNELARIESAVKPTERLFVADATTGQEAVNVAKEFHRRVRLTGAIFTKLDGDSRGGAVLSVRAAVGVPVRFVGIGEQTDAFEPFYPDRMAERILGMGDVLGIIEKAEKAFSGDSVGSIQKSAMSGQFDFNFMLNSFQSMRKMGPLKNVFKMLPGVHNMVSEEALDNIDERDMARIEAIILSMTPKERSNPDIINGSRRKRLAQGSGSSVEQVNGLIRQLYDMRRTMKGLAGAQQRFGKKLRRNK